MVIVATQGCEIQIGLGFTSSLSWKHVNPIAEAHVERKSLLCHMRIHALPKLAGSLFMEDEESLHNPREKTAHWDFSAKPSFLDRKWRVCFGLIVKNSYGNVNKRSLDPEKFLQRILTGDVASMMLKAKHN